LQFIAGEESLDFLGWFPIYKTQRLKAATPSNREEVRAVTPKFEKTLGPDLSG
jgi:hypothetical protein